MTGFAQRIIGAEENVSCGTVGAVLNPSRELRELREWAAQNSCRYQRH